MAPSANTILNVEGLGKRYRLFSTPRDRLLSLLGLTDRSTAHWALKDVSFNLHRGQCLGVIGDNGAGKSTLLKLLAGTLQASHGQLHRVGRLTAILELGAGFHPDFTGRENLMFGGSFIGLGRDDMLRLSDEIITIPTSPTAMRNRSESGVWIRWKYYSASPTSSVRTVH